MSNIELDIDKKSQTLTTNGMVTNFTTLNSCLDLFFSIGAMRGKSKLRLNELFENAYKENALVATKILFWSRDIRGGSGERGIFRNILTELVKTNPETIKNNLHLIPEFGRWDDVLVLVDTQLENLVFELIKDSLNKKDGLCAKWMPRKGLIANRLRRYLKLNPKNYRKLLVELTNVVETKMCAKDWELIDYSKIPSIAASRYQKTFTRNDGERYQEYINALRSGDTKINAGALYPYDIVKSIYMGGNEDVCNKQWESLPNWMENVDERVLPVVDVSSSMECPAGGNPNLTCMDVAISLGIYISERNLGNFKDAFVTFSSRPKLQYLTGTLKERITQLQRADWGYNTNLESVFNLILNQAKYHNISEDLMPTKILILSDMEFDEASNENSYSQTMIENMYEDAGYKKPDIIYWNLNGGGSNFPVEFDKSGAALVSGFSPSILKSILGCENISPELIMMNTINNDRYNLITV